VRNPHASRPGSCRSSCRRMRAPMFAAALSPLLWSTVCPEERIPSLAPDFEWERVVDSPLYPSEGCNAVRAIGEGLVAAGWAGGRADPRCALWRVDAAGELVGSQRLAPVRAGACSVARCVRESAGGGLFLVGREDLCDVSPGSQVYVTMTDAAGIPVWRRLLGAGAASSILVEDNHVVIGGSGELGSGGGFLAALSLTQSWCSRFCTAAAPRPRRPSRWPEPTQRTTLSAAPIDPAVRDRAPDQAITRATAQINSAIGSRRSTR